MTSRDRQILRAVASGHAELVCGCEPHLLVDGLNICDTDAHNLTHAGLIGPAVPGLPGMRVRARLTDAGLRELGVAA